MKSKATCRSNYYKGHYLISAYTADDKLVGVYANTQEASDKLRVSRWKIYHALRNDATIHGGIRFYPIDLLPTMDVFKDEDIETYKLFIRGEI